MADAKPMPAGFRRTSNNSPARILQFRRQIVFASFIHCDHGNDDQASPRPKCRNRTPLADRSRNYADRGGFSHLGAEGQSRQRCAS